MIFIAYFFPFFSTNFTLLYAPSPINDIILYSLINFSPFSFTFFVISLSGIPVSSSGFSTFDK